MAGKKKEPRTEYGIQQEVQQPQQMEQDAQREQMMQQADNAIMQQDKALQQEQMNKAHDIATSAYADGSTQETMKVIGDHEVAEAMQILQKYKEGKTNLENNIIENEQWWKMRNWNFTRIKEEKEKRIEPCSAWLFNAIANKHADAMDNFPEPNVLARAQDDREAAKTLSSIVPVILEQNDYEKVYSDVEWYKLKAGTGVTGIFWDGSKQNGLGDITIKKMDVLNLYWESGISNIQDSSNVFYVTLEDNDKLKAMYPELKSFSGAPEINATKYIYDDTIDTTEKSAVVDWYYKRSESGTDEQGLPYTRTILQYCKCCNGQVLYASENDPVYAEKGWYDHGLYPFVFDALFPVEGSICGFSYIDVMKNSQMYIDQMQQAIIENCKINAVPRYAVRDDAGLNQEEFTDLSKTLVHFSGNLGEDAFRQIVASPISGIYESIMLNKIDELKDTSGNTAASQGQTTNVTSASGIASLQEASGKLARDSNKSAYRAFKDICYMVIELIRQFYTEPRCFRITGRNGQEEYQQFDNGSIQPQEQGTVFGVDLGSRMPVFDIKVIPQKQSAYTRETQNQLALQFYNLGFFAPDNADATLSCLNMMDFDGKNQVIEKIDKNKTLLALYMQAQQQLMAATQMVDVQNGTNFSERVAGQAQQNASQLEQGGQAKSKSTLNSAGRKGSFAQQAASATRNSTSV